MKYCFEQGCRNLISQGRYCEKHQRKKKEIKRKAYYSQNHDFYTSKTWQGMRSYIYEKYRGCCSRCGKFTFGREAHVHHIIPIVVAPHLKLDEDNLILLCSSCHSIVERATMAKYFPKKKNKKKNEFNWNL